MNQHTAHEHASATVLRDSARILVATYADPQDAEASRLALLMVACELEAREQGITAPLIFSYGGEV